MLGQICTKSLQQQQQQQQYMGKWTCERRCMEDKCNGCSSLRCRSSVPFVTFSTLNCSAEIFTAAIKNFIESKGVLSTFAVQMKHFALHLKFLQKYSIVASNRQLSPLNTLVKSGKQFFFQL
jgi:hypothetical protein